MNANRPARRPKKLRSDSKFAALTEEQRAELAAMLLAGQRSLEDIVAWLGGLGITVSAQAVSNYHRRWVLPTRWQTLNAAAASLNNVSADAAAGAAHKALRQLTFELATTPGADAKEVIELYRAMIAGEKSEQDARRLALLEQKAAAADAARAALESKKAAGGLSPETMNLIEEQLRLL